MVSDTEALHPQILILNAKANLCLGQLKRGRSSLKRANDMADILYNAASGRNIIWSELSIVEAFMLAAEGDIDRGFDFVFKAMEIAERLYSREHQRVGELFIIASKLCVLENDEEEALEYATKAHAIFSKVLPGTSRRCADAALRVATLGAIVGQGPADVAPLFDAFLRCAWYPRGSLPAMAARRWCTGRDHDGLNTLARVVLCVDDAPRCRPLCWFVVPPEPRVALRLVVRQGATRW